MFFRKNKKASVLNRFQEEKLYEFVMGEINSGVRRDGLWGKALVQAEGDPNKTESAYIKLRIQSLIDEYTIEQIMREEFSVILSQTAQNNTQQEPLPDKENISKPRPLQGYEVIEAPDKDYVSNPATIAWYRSSGVHVRKGWTICSLKTTSGDIHQIMAPEDVEIGDILVPSHAKVTKPRQSLCYVKVKK